MLASKILRRTYTTCSRILFQRALLHQVLLPIINPVNRWLLCRIALAGYSIRPPSLGRQKTVRRETRHEGKVRRARLALFLSLRFLDLTTSLSPIARRFKVI